MNVALNTGQRVVQNDRTEITLADLNSAIPSAVEKHTIQSAYLTATRSTRAENLYRQVLLACALAPKNRLGYFTAGAIREPLRVIAGRWIDIPAFARHLARFLEPARGSVLQREGEPRNYFYRFSDPMVAPYVILNGLSDGLITDGQRVAIQGHDDAITPVEPPTEPPRLF